MIKPSALWKMIVNNVLTTIMRKASVPMRYMKHVLGFLILLCAVPAMAQVPSGTFTYVFTNLPLWDVTGTYAVSGTTNGVTDNATFVITNAASGKITGTQAEIINDGSVVVDVSSTVSGKISIKAGAVVSSLRSKGTFTGTVSGKASGKSTETIDASTTGIVANVSERLSSHGKSVKFSATTTAPLPAGMTGDWTLVTDITASGTKLSGTGTVTLSNGRALPYQITGNFSTRTEDAKLRLKGQGDALGSSIAMTTSGTNMDLTVLKGKILGQKPTVTVTP